MKIGIDISQLAFPGTGVASYTENLVRELLKNDQDNRYVLFGSSLRRKKVLENFTRSLSGGNCSEKLFGFPPSFLETLWNRLHVLPLERLIGGVDVFHSSDWIQPPTGARKVTTVHDLVVYKYPQSSHAKTQFRTDVFAPSANIVAVQKRRLRWVKNECDLIIADSLATKKDLREILNIPEEKVRVIYLAAGREFTPKPLAEVEAVRKKYRLENKYFLCIGTREPRKNLDRVGEAFRQLETGGVDLVWGGNYGWGSVNKVNKNNKTIKMLGFVPQEDLPALYSGAAAFVYPSLYEGFGVPVLEAMACGCPVITSNTGSLPEVGADAAFYVNPEDLGEIAEKMSQILRLGNREREDRKTAGLRQAGNFSWAKTARETLKVYEELV